MTRPVEQISELERPVRLGAAIPIILHMPLKPHEKRANVTLLGQLEYGTSLTAAMSI